MNAGKAGNGGDEKKVEFVCSILALTANKKEGFDFAESFLFLSFHCLKFVLDKGTTLNAVIGPVLFISFSAVS